MLRSSRNRVKTDNQSLPLKLHLRRWVIDAAGFKEVRVLDLCAGEGLIWRALRKEYQVRSYCPCDIKPRIPGTLKGDVYSERFLNSLDLACFNVLDLDTYGEPWQPWFTLAARIRQRMAIFLTHGLRGSAGGFPISSFALRKLGIPEDWYVPRQLALAQFSATRLLYSTARWCTIYRLGRITLPTVTYYGLLVGPKGEPSPQHPTCRSQEGLLEEVAHGGEDHHRLDGPYV